MSALLFPASSLAPRASRERDQALLEAEVQRRLALPLDQWELVRSLEEFTADARAYLDEPQHVTMHGKPAVVILSEADYRQLVAAAQASRESFADHLLAFPGDLEHRLGP